MRLWLQAVARFYRYLLRLWRRFTVRHFAKVARKDSNLQSGDWYEDDDIESERGSTRKSAWEMSDSVSSRDEGSRRWNESVILLDGDTASSGYFSPDPIGASTTGWRGPNALRTTSQRNLTVKFAPERTTSLFAHLKSLVVPRRNDRSRSPGRKLVEVIEYERPSSSAEACTPLWKRRQLMGFFDESDCDDDSPRSPASSAGDSFGMLASSGRGAGSTTTMIEGSHARNSSVSTASYTQPLPRIEVIPPATTPPESMRDGSVYSAADTQSIYSALESRSAHSLQDTRRSSHSLLDTRSAHSTDWQKGYVTVAEHLAADGGSPIGRATAASIPMEWDPME